MLTMSEVNFARLLPVLEGIETHKLTGCLIGMGTGQQAHLYFNNGSLTDAQLQPGNSSGEEVLYSLLNWQAGQLHWQANKTSATVTIDSQQAADFFQAAEDMAGLGYFERTSHRSDAEIEQFLTATTASVAPTPATPPLTLPVTPPLNTVPLPSGEPFQLVSLPLSFSDLASLLQDVSFTGYWHWQDDARAVTVAFDAGHLAAIQLYQAGQTYNGKTAWSLFSHWSHAPVGSELVTLDRAVLESWRALLGASRPYHDLPATVANFNGLLNTFERSRYSGAIAIRFGTVSTYAFIYEGRELGSYKLASGSHHLKPVEGELFELLGNSQVQLDVYVSRLEEFETASNIFKPGEVTTLAGTLSAMIGLVDTLTSGNGLLRLFETVGQSNYTHPWLVSLISLDWPDDTEQRATLLSRWLGSLRNVSRSDLFKGLEVLLDAYLQPTCLKIGSAMFHEMAVRALGPVHVTNLQRMGLRVDFFDPPPATAPAAEPGWTSAATVQDENPYDF